MNKLQKKSSRELFFIIGIISLLLVIGFYDVFFLGKTFKLTTGNPQALITGVYGQEHNKPAYFWAQSTDVNIFEDPIYELIKLSLQKGIFPLWNPYQGCGYPLISMIQIGFFFPLNFFLYFLPQTWAWDVMILSRLFFAGLFTYWFMRSLRFARIPSLGAAVVFMFTGPMLLMQYSFAHVELLVPLLLLAYEKLIRRPDIRTCAFTAIVLAMTCIAGNPEHTFLVNVFCFAYLIFRSLTIRPKVDLGKIIFFFLIAGLFSFGLSAFVLLPFINDFLTEFWHTHPENMGLIVEGKNKVLRYLLSFTFPHFYQNVPVTMEYGRSSMMGHFGIIPLGLAFFSLFSRQRRWLNFFFFGLLFLNFAKNFLDFFLTDWIASLPLFRDVRYFLHTHHLFGFCIAFLAGMGIRVLLSGKHRFKIGLLYALIISVFGALSLWHFRNAEHFSNGVAAYKLGLGMLAIFLLTVALAGKDILKSASLKFLIIAITFLELFIYIPRGRVNRFDSFPKIPYVEFLKNTPDHARVYGIFWTLFPNTATAYEIDDLGLEEGLLSKRFVHFVNHFLIPDHFSKDFGNSSLRIVPITFVKELRPYLDLLNVKYTLAPDNISRTFMPMMQQPGFPKPIYQKEISIYEHPGALPRAFIVHRALFEPKEELVFEKIKLISRGFREGLVIHGNPAEDILQKLETAPLSDTSEAKIVKYTPNEILLTANVENPGFLFLSETYHPSWKVFVNEKESKIYNANYIGRAVFLDKGLHSIHFRFVPMSFYWGLGISLGSLLLLIGLVAFPSFRKSSLHSKRNSHTTDKSQSFSTDTRPGYDAAQSFSN